MIRRVHSLLIVVLLAGFLARVQAAQWNWFMHADVIDDATVSASVHRDGRFLSFPNPLIAHPADHPPLPMTGGQPLKLHGPLMPLLGAAVTAIRGGESTIADAFLSLRILSLLSGMLVIILSFFAASRLFDETAGLAAAAWTSASYILIDYSGNGALYMTQSAICLLWLLLALHPPSARRALLLGAVAGTGYLVNFQCMLLVPAGLLVLAAQERPWPRFLLRAALLAGVAAAIASPWLVRNAIVFGDPFYSHASNMHYLYGKAGMADKLPNVNFRDKLEVLSAIVESWLPNNTYYAARKLFVIAPFAFFLFSYGLIDIAFSRERFRRSLPLVILFLFQMLLYGAWPVWKFRFFVPLLPLVFILALEQLHHLPVTQAWKYRCIGVTFLSLVALSALTYRAVPTHTSYFDGALTQDPFHSSEEETYLRKLNLLPPR